MLLTILHAMAFERLPFMVATKIQVVRFPPIRRKFLAGLSSGGGVKAGDLCVAL
jgi:hypothetical protein